MEKIILIIPAYNEEENILNTYNKIMKYNKEYNVSYDVIIINDGSTDNTSRICHEHNMPVIDLVQNLGIGGAVQTGYKYANERGYDIAVQYDGDGQHEVAYVKTITDPIINKEADMVIGSRFVKKIDTFQSSFARRVGIRIISGFMKFAAGYKILDTTSGFRACSKSIINEFANDYPSEYPEPITTAEIMKKRYKVKEVSVEMSERQGGQSSIRAWKTIYYMVNVCLSLLVVKARRYEGCHSI